MYIPIKLQLLLSCILINCVAMVNMQISDSGPPIKGVTVDILTLPVVVHDKVMTTTAPKHTHKISM